MEVLIVGGGIAGLSAAIGLGRSGHRVTIVEAAKGLIPVGAGIQMPPNATKIFRNWDILDAVKAFATVPEEVCFRSYRDGSVLHRHKLSPDTQDNFGSPHLQIHRRQLIEVLYKTALEAGATVRFGCPVKHVEHGPTKTTVLVAGGKSFLADMVVAGDGERSVLRSLMLGKPNAPVPTGTLVYRLNVDPQAVLDDPELSKELKLPIMCSWLGPDAHAVVYNLDYNDMVTVAITCPDPKKGRVQLGPREASVEELKTAMAGWNPMLLKLLDMATDVRFWTLLQLPEENRVWQMGKVILIGDAAHSMTPYIAQGASQSIEDGAFLGYLFPRDTTVEDIEPRLKQFCDRRQARTLRVRGRAREVGAVFQMADGAEQEARDERMRQGELTDNFPNPFADPHLQSWLYTYDVKTDAEEAMVATRKA